MIELTVLCEGPTEVGFVNRLLRPHMEPVAIVKALPLRNANFGVVPFEMLYRAWKGSVGRARPYQFTTCMIDLYALPKDYRQGVSEGSNKLETVQNIETALRAKLPSPQWLPYVQLHEFEALIYADLDELVKQFPDEDLTIGLRDLRSEIGNLSPEDIDESKEYAPSKRLLRHVPHYGKAAAGPAATEAIGLEKLRKACPHFDEWIASLERIAGLPLKT